MTRFNCFLASLSVHVLLLAAFSYLFTTEALFNDQSRSSHVAVRLGDADRRLPVNKSSIQTNSSVSDPVADRTHSNSRISSFISDGSETAPPYGEAVAKPKDKVNPLPYYPDSAKRSGQEGVVLLLVSLSKDGLVTSVKLLKSSGHRILDHFSK
jgi:hypothetical protein